MITAWIWNTKIPLLRGRQHRLKLYLYLSLLLMLVCGLEILCTHSTYMSPLLRAGLPSSPSQRRSNPIGPSGSRMPIYLDPSRAPSELSFLSFGILVNIGIYHSMAQTIRSWIEQAWKWRAIFSDRDSLSLTPLNVSYNYLYSPAR